MRKRKILIREWEERRVGGSMKEREKIMKDLEEEEELGPRVWSYWKMRMKENIKGRRRGMEKNAKEEKAMKDRAVMMKFQRSKGDEEPFLKV